MPAKGNPFSGAGPLWPPPPNGNPILYDHATGEYAEPNDVVPSQDGSEK
ncbi:hypothetical protein GCM10025781_01740 [Kocuria gwangalliensis]|uniref:Uncharacterized protein n=1 Tax=Kocuria gwangalliensis TaxID=501592 RepID=A0ABP8WFE3_9MICC